MCFRITAYPNLPKGMFSVIIFRLIKELENKKVVSSLDKITRPIVKITLNVPIKNNKSKDKKIG